MKLPKGVRDVLDATGLPWSVEAGSRHGKIKINGRIVTIVPLNGGNDRDRATKNVIAHIRRASRSA